MLEIIKNSFEHWYNTTHDEKVSIVANYSDEQTLLIKAYHKVTITMMAIGIRNSLSYTLPLLEVSEYYNHGVTTEEAAKEHVLMLFLSSVLEYCSGKSSN